jgi:hypothetical protein
LRLARASAVQAARFWADLSDAVQQDVDLVNAALAGIERADYEHHGDTHLAPATAVTFPTDDAPA